MAKHVMMIKDMNCEHCKMRIEKALNLENINCDINLEHKTVSVEGNSDILAAAKRIISAEGYTVL